MGSNVGVTFGICTYNRKNILERSAASLSQIKDINRVNIRIYDDCSTEFDEAYLWSLFPKAVSIKINLNNVGADKNTSMMYEDFLKTGDQWLFNADSDLLYRTDIIDKIANITKGSKEFVTLFNCINHNTITKSEEFVVKDSVGAAGCLLSRKCVELILSNIKERQYKFDVGFCKLLREKGYKLYATKESYVQHIGIHGYNSRDINFDYGKCFICDNLTNAQAIEETFEQYIRTVAEYKKTSSWRIYNFFISIPRRIKKITKIVRARIVHETN